MGKRLHHIAAGLGLLSIAGVLGAAAVWLLFTTFMPYDDEGYVLRSYLNFSLHGQLYTQVYTQYGPFPYVLLDGLHRVLAFPFDNTTGRWLAWIHWLGTAGCCAALVGRSTRAFAPAAFTLAGVFAYLWVTVNEPAHPGGLLALLLAAAAWVGAEALRAGRFGVFAATMGAAGAAMALTKINVGAFFILSVGVWMALNSRLLPLRLVRWSCALLVALLPFLLMRTLFAEAWVRTYGLLFSASALSLLVLAPQFVRRQFSASTWIAFITAGLGLAAVVVTVTVVRGTSLRGLLEGVLLNPLKHPGVYFFPVNWRIGSTALAVFSLATAAWLSRGEQLHGDSWKTAVAAARWVAGLLFIAATTGLIPTSAAGWGMSYGISLLVWFVFPLGREASPEPNIRAWLAFLLIFQFLHAYPVAGSQMNWGSFLWVPLLACGLHEATAWLTRGAAARWRAVPVALLMAAAVVISGRFAQIGADRYHNSRPLDLPGAADLRLPNGLDYAIRIVVANARLHGDLLFSLPGSFSLNTWSGLPTPTLANATHWFSLLSDGQQREIIDRLAAHDRSLLIVQRSQVDYLRDGSFPIQGPLYDWLTARFELAFGLEGYELWVQRGRRIHPLFTARDRSTPGTTVIELNVAPTAQPVHQIEICHVDLPQAPLLVLNRTQAELTFRPLLSAVAPAERPFDGRLSEAGILTARFSPVPLPLNLSETLIILRSETGEVLQDLRYAHFGPAVSDGAPPAAGSLQKGI